MQIIRKDISQTKVKLSIKASDSELTSIKKQVLQHFAGKMKLPGFRSGKAPLYVIEKNIDSNILQAEFVDEAINHLYQDAVKNKSLRTVNSPKVSIKKFVPFTELEFEAEIEVVGKVTLPDYSKIKKQRDSVIVSEKDVTEVIDNLRIRSAEKKDVERSAKKNDQVIIDFKGVDSKGIAINGAEGKDYPLVLGSNSFIPGFEDNLTGLKNAETKTFTLTFPKGYGVKSLANKIVTFTVTVKKVQELIEPKLDDEFAAKVGPFKTISELKKDIKTQLENEKSNQADRMLENEIIQEIVKKSKLEVPETLVTDQIVQLKNEVRQNLIYRGQTWEEMLKAEGKTEEEYVTEQLKPEAELRVKTGLILAEISIAEGLEISPEELEVRMQILKTQYTDPTMQAELAKPEARREIASRMLTEKTIQKLVELATK